MPEETRLSFLKMLHELDDKIMAALPPGQHAPCPGCGQNRWKKVAEGFQCRQLNCGFVRPK